MAILITPALVLASPVSVRGPNAPIIGWHNVVTLGGIVADHELAAFPASNLANPSTTLRWQSDSTDEQYVTFSIPGTDPVDYVGLARHNLGSTGVNVSVEIIDPEDEEAWIEVFAPVVLVGDAPAVLRFEPVHTTQIRLRLQPVGTAPRIAVVYVGKLLILPRGMEQGHVPVPFAAADEVVSGQAESGDFLGRIVTNQSLSTAVAIQNLSYDWFRANMGAFAKGARTSPFFFAWMPGTYPSDVGYAWLDGDLRPETVRLATGIAVNVSMQMKALAL